MESIKARYKHTKFGTFMFKLCANWTVFIVKHKILYYLLSLTWGVLLTIVGVFVTLALAIAKIFNHNIKFSKYDWVYSISVGSCWGGFETGLMFVRDSTSYTSLDAHEFGHTFQNTLFGPLQIFLSLSSAIRYWYQTIREWKGKTNKPYDSYWLEDVASQCGAYAHWYLINNK